MSSFSRGIQIFKEGLTVDGGQPFRKDQEERFTKAFFEEFNAYKKKSKTKSDLRKIVQATIRNYFDNFTA